MEAAQEFINKLKTESPELFESVRKAIISDYYRNIGKKGVAGRLAGNPELARDLGRKGGAISKGGGRPYHKGYKRNEGSNA